MNSLKRIVRLLMIIGYTYFILTKTIIGRTVLPDPLLRGLFWELREGYWNDIIMNILLFIPLGFLIGGWKGVVIGFALSCGIEMLQYVCRTGFCEIDDILNNTIGAGIGAGIQTITHSVRMRFQREYKEIGD